MGQPRVRPDRLLRFTGVRNGRELSTIRDWLQSDGVPIIPTLALSALFSLSVSLSLSRSRLLLSHQRRLRKRLRRQGEPSPFYEFEEGIDESNKGE